ncbi:M28 family metallopeptidase [Parvularcula sp. IMCC14364]|uniref:M28 family metallopeptidase n=1 Tax=Parvularcula sp. IMCC14364 TaxID=3067902 RepID=UPI0027429B9D|nr:M28 family metallopeptidase [Parvularcula sp. IMCC14364]
MKNLLKSGLISSVAALALVACETTGTTGTSASAAKSVTMVAPSPSAENIERHITYLADDALQGREAGTEGYQQAADYVADELKKLGLEPAGDDGSWFQQVPLRSTKRDMDGAFMSLSRDGATQELAHLDDYIIGFPANGKTDEIAADLVFVGYGLQAPEFGIDDYAGVNVEGKIVVVLLGVSADMPSEEAAHYNSTRTRRLTAEANGAVGMISVYDKSSAQRFPWDRVKLSADRASMSWVKKDGTTFTPAPGIRVTATMSPEQGAMLFEGAEMSYADILAMTDEGDTRPPAFVLDGKAKLKSAAVSEDVSSPNVVAILPGSDPDLKDEYVLLSAHLDHTGQRESDDPDADTINNGALDNASGIATTLEATRMLASLAEAGKLRRSVVVTAVTAEEKGLLGSEYYANYPTVPLDSIVANVNLDMPIITYPFVDVIAFGADHSSLGETVREAAAKMDLELIPDPIPQLSIFTRSDHYRFVQQGIPAVFLFLGFGNGGEQQFNDFMNNRYHRPGDDLEQALDFEQGARFSKLNYLVAKSIANADERPTWNEGNFFGELFSKD